MIIDGVYQFSNHILVNSAEFTRTRDEFIRSKKRNRDNPQYTTLHPKYDKAEYEAFWREERRRRKEGYSVGGVRITGHHYNFLNFTQMDRSIRPDGKESKVAAKEMDFPDMWDGHFEMYHAKEEAKKLGLHFLGGKSRTKGFSYVGGADAANTVELNRNKTVILGAFDKAYLTKGDGIFTMAKSCFDFYNKYTEFYHNRLINTNDTIKLGYRLKGDDVDYGHKGQLITASFKNNPAAIRGKRALEVYLEELGTFPNLKGVLSASLPAMEDGGYTTGQLLCWGTGGDDEADWEAFEEVYFNPIPYKFVAFPNIWDNDGGGKVCGYFFPFWKNLIPFIDENGNSKEEVAKEASKAMKQNALDTMTTIAEAKKWIAERADSPNEAFSRSSTNLFSSIILDEWVSEVSQNPKYQNFGRVGQIHSTVDGIKFVPNVLLKQLGHPTHDVINNVPIKPTEDVTGAFVEWHPPVVLANGQIPPIYRVWVDPFGTDKEKKEIRVRDSLMAVYVYERINPYTEHKGDILVGAYVGRPSTLTEADDIVFAIAKRYGGHRCIFFEKDRGTLKKSAEKRKLLHLLEFAPDTNLSKQSTSQRDYGYSMNDSSGVKKHTAALYYKDWLYTVRKVLPDGTERYNLHYINDLGLLRETQKFSLGGNYDRLSAIFVGMYDMHEVNLRPFKANANVRKSNDFFNRKLF